MFKSNDKEFLYGSLALVAALCVWPFLAYDHRYPITSFYNEWIAFTLGLAALLPLMRLSFWQRGVPILALFPLALALWLCVQWLCGRGGPVGPVPATLYLLWFSALIVLGAALRRTFGLPIVVGVIAWALFLGGELNTFCGFVQHYLWNTPFNSWIDAKVGPAVFGNLAQPNHYADYLALGLVSLIYLYACGRIHVAVAAVAAAPMIFAMGLSGSRSAWLYVIALPLLALLLHRCGASNRRWLWATVFLFIGFALAQWVMTLSWFAPPSGASAQQIVTSTERVLGSGAGSTAVRVDLWREGWHAFLRSPWFGTGMGGFAWQFYQFQSSIPDSVSHGFPNNQAHNLFLQWFVEAGVIGGVLVLAAFIVWARDLWRAAISLEQGWLFGVMAVLGIHSMLEYPFWYSYFLGIAGLVLGLGATRWMATDVYTWLPRAWRVALTVGLITGVYYLAITVVDYRAYQAWRYPASGASSAEGAQQSAAWRKQAMAAIDRDPLLAQYIKSSLVSDIEINAEHIEEKLAFNTQVMHYKPNGTTVYMQALLLAERNAPGDAEAARAQLVGAMYAYPNVLKDMMKPLGVLAEHEPAKFKPLLELASSQLAKTAAAQAGVGDSAITPALPQTSGKE